MNRQKSSTKAKRFRYNSLLWVLCAFWVLGAILFAERSGIRYTVSDLRQAYLPAESSLRAGPVHRDLPKTCLLLENSQDINSEAAIDMLEHVLTDMKVGYTLRDVSRTDIYDFADYETVVLALSNISPLESKVLELADWVKNGGSALFAVPLEYETYTRLLDPKLGVISSGARNAVVESYHPAESFMLGGGRSYPISTPFESSRSVTLRETATVHAWSGDERRVPLIWEHPYGEGKFVVVNLGNYEKTVRGFYAAAYSLMTDCVAYPVINGAAFYLDDFPAPVPSGNDTYIRRDYDLSIEKFYSDVWWLDLLDLASNYSIKYTGALMESLDSNTSGTVTRTIDTQKFHYFGNMLLHQQGEIAYHGYNHQPFCLSNVTYPQSFSYKTWSNAGAMKRSMEELISFSKELFPSIQKSVYVPPSNILSAEGRKLIAEQFPEIRTISSSYLPSDFVYDQEFEVAPDGIVEQPRITSSCTISDYMMLTAVSELNLHLVNTHAIQPDEPLNEYRGAEQGWEAMKANLDAYMGWLYASAPQIEPLTASQLSGHIQRFAAVAAETTVTKDEVQFKIHNLHDSAYFMVRFNEGTPGEVSGGVLEHMTGNLYLLRADAEQITIKLNR